jgi:hypothetical protein
MVCAQNVLALWHILVLFCPDSPYVGWPSLSYSIRCFQRYIRSPQKVGIFGRGGVRLHFRCCLWSVYGVHDDGDIRSQNWCGHRNSLCCLYVILMVMNNGLDYHRSGSLHLNWLFFCVLSLWHKRGMG